MCLVDHQNVDVAGRIWFTKAQLGQTLIGMSMTACYIIYSLVALVILAIVREEMGQPVGEKRSLSELPVSSLPSFQGSQKELLNLTQQDYTNRIEELNQSLKDAWASDQKVKALKIVIQVGIVHILTQE